MPRIMLFVALCCCSIAYGQTGPGGVGNSATNMLWLDAGSGITATASALSSWADRSGNGNNAVQTVANLKPLLATNVLNGRPAVVFDNDQLAADHLRIADRASLGGMNGLTGFAVYSLAAGTPSAVPRCILGKRNGVDLQEAYDWFIWNSGSILVQALDIDGTGNRALGTDAVPAGVPCVNSFVYKGSTPANAQNQVLYKSNTAVGNASEASAVVPNYASDIYLGILKGHTGSGPNVTRFNGSMAEVILYNFALGSAQRVIVNNYLAAKYGLALASGDLYVQDEVAHGNYDIDVAGIGQVAVTDRQLDSRGTGIVRISGATDLNNDEFLLWGSDAGALGTFGVGDRPTGVQGRWQRVWRVNEVKSSGVACDVGAIDIEFDLTGQGAVTASDLRLLVDTQNDGNFANDVPVGGAVPVVGDKYRFPGVTAITNGVRFTLGSINIIATPLPVELLSFTAAPDAEGDVRLGWTTASEHDNDHFTVQRSTDASQWTPIGALPGAGTSNALLHYALVDPAPIMGTSYYRLQQTDMNGTSTLSDIVSVVVSIVSHKDITVFPNPARGRFSVIVEDAASWEVRLIDPQGKSMALSVQCGDHGVVVDVASFAPGPYLLVLVKGDERRSTRIILR
ncbi:MAG: T9SS type A sorting domain-containing protein [Flavobacteriales bacterium]